MSEANLYQVAFYVTRDTSWLADRYKYWECVSLVISAATPKEAEDTFRKHVEASGRQVGDHILTEARWGYTDKKGSWWALCSNI